MIRRTLLLLLLLLHTPSTLLLLLLLLLLPPPPPPPRPHTHTHIGLFPLTMWLSRRTSSCCGHCWRHSRGMLLIPCSAAMQAPINAALDAVQPPAIIVDRTAVMKEEPSEVLSM
jgi:hypothetical protein